MLSYSTFLTATTTDVFKDTDLQQLPEAGSLEVWLASTGNASTYTLAGPGIDPQGAAKANGVPQRSNGEPSLIDDMPLVVPVSAGKYVLNVTRGGTETIGVRSRYHSARELGV